MALHQKTAVMKYKSTKDCEWSVRWFEVTQARKIDQEFEVTDDCTLKRKAAAGDAIIDVQH
jgi:hypothetical protein